MIRTIGLEQVQKMKEQGAPNCRRAGIKRVFRRNIPRAINIPLLHLNASSVAMLDKNRPIIVYCWDYQ